MRPYARWRGARFVVFLVFLLFTTLDAVFCGGAAHAAPPGAEAHVASALITPARTDSGIGWHAHWVLTPESASELQAGTTLALRFALPLAGEDSVEATWGIAPLVESGRVTGLLVDRAALDGRTVTAIVDQPIRLDGDAVMRIGAPVAAGTALQIVNGDLGSGTRLEPETGGSFERRVGYVAPPGISHAAREEARRLTGYDAQVTGAALYVRGDDVKAANGLTGTIITARARARHTTTAIALLFVALVVALLAAVRKLRNAASVERADALLAAEVDALDTSPHRRRGAR